MEMKTRSGICINIRSSNPSSFLFFDKPVRVIELSREESIRLGSSLMKTGRIGITSELRKLIASGFLDASKSFSKIETELILNGIEVKKTSLNLALTKMVERRELTRSGQKGVELYNRAR